MATSPPVPPLKNAKLITAKTFNAWRQSLGNIKVTLNPGQKWEYGWLADPAIHDIETLEMKVFVLDNEDTSPTYGFYIPADAIVFSGWTENGNMVVINNHTEAQDFLIRAVMYMHPINLTPVVG